MDTPTDESGLLTQQKPIKYKYYHHSHEHIKARAEKLCQWRTRSARETTKATSIRWYSDIHFQTHKILAHEPNFLHRSGEKSFSIYYIDFLKKLVGDYSRLNRAAQGHPVKDASHVPIEDDMRIWQHTFW